MTTPKIDAPPCGLDKRLLRQSIVALQERMGLSHDPNATGEQSQAMTLASGIKPESRELSSEILGLRQQGRL